MAAPPVSGKTAPTRAFRSSVAPLAGGAALAALLCAAGPARAQALTDNAYALDLFQGPILAPLRVTGLSGAYAGYAEGIEGMVANAAAPAVREPSSFAVVDLDVAGSVSFPLPFFGTNDFNNSGARDRQESSFLYGTGGARIQVGAFGLGAHAELQRYSTADAGGAVTHVTVGRHRVLGAVGLLDGQLVLGAGARIVTLGVEAPEATLTLAGLAPEAGLLIRPDWRSFRIGATFRGPVEGGELLGTARTVDENGVERAGGLVVPRRVVLPWELEIGVAVQVGPRPLNPEWIDPRDQARDLEVRLARERTLREQRRRGELMAITDPEERAAREREHDALRAQELLDELAEAGRATRSLLRERRARHANWPREHLLFTADLVVTGAVSRAVGLETFLRQNDPDLAAGPSKVGTAARSVNFSPRFGIETEPVVGLVQTRFGSYYEPRRLGEGMGRQHFTFGADLRVFETTWFGLVPEIVYKLQAAVDIAPRYESASLGVGVWH